MSSGLDFIVTLIPLCPLLACFATAIFGPRILKEKSHLPAVFGCGAACVCSVIALLSLLSGAAPPKTIELFNWIQIPAVAGNLALQIPIALRLDSLSAIMLSMVTFVSTLVAIYASGYMHGERGYWRFFSEVSLFVFSMTMLVLSANFAQLYMFWEAVGLCSYLLIGFWYEKPSAAAAGMKAFLVNRIGDFGFAVGVFLIWMQFGSLNFADVLFNEKLLANEAALNPATLELICFCLFTGAVGKSAQFPLHVWLPDAMEDPTPVSALIHAATMVTAGVYMVSRCSVLFMHAPQAQLTVSLIGGITALMAAIIAVTQTDLKRVLAYSTVSQLGYMFLGLGTGTYLGVAGAMFHLVTHAFFKALLFLGAGSVMHAMGGVIDMRRFGGLRKVMPTTYWTFLVGSVALAGLFPLSGFWSKDTILSAVRAAGRPAAHAAPHDAEVTDHTPAGTDHADAVTETQSRHAPQARPSKASLGGIPAPTWYMILYWIGTFTAFLTAFYTTRAFLMTFHGDVRIPEEAGHHAHESPPVMCIPLMILAVGAAFLGLVFGHLTGWFDHFLAATLPKVGEHHPLDWVVAGTSTLVAVVGIVLGWGLYAKPSALPGRIAKALGPLTRLSEEKFYLDQIYAAAVVLPLRGLAQLARFLDWIFVDGALVGLFSRLPADLGQLVRPMQNGLVQFYALSMMLAMAVLMWALIAGQG